MKTRSGYTARGWAIALFSAFCTSAAMTTGHRVLLSAGVAGIALIILAPLAAGPAVRRAKIRWHAPRSVAANEAAHIDVAIALSSPRKHLWAPYLDTNLEVSAEPELPTLAAQAESSSARFTLRSPQRGAIELGHSVLSRTDPFGLFVRRTVVGEGFDLLVTPLTLPLDPSQTSPVSGERHESASTALRQQLADGIVRQYRPGDDVRRVHWRSSAKRGDLMVRAEEPTRAETVELLLDARREAYPARGSHDFEAAITATASILADQLGRATRTRFVVVTGDQTTQSEDPQEWEELMALIQLGAPLPTSFTGPFSSNDGRAITPSTVASTTVVVTGTNATPESVTDAIVAAHGAAAPRRGSSHLVLVTSGAESGVRSNAPRQPQASDELLPASWRSTSPANPAGPGVQRRRLSAAVWTPDRPLSEVWRHLHRQAQAPQ